jgi:NAD(P)-dependent dehydrogenase (short-subunit alcohol dehydrogenase family)
MRGLDQKRVLVTGAASSVGLAIAARLRDEGATVAILDVDEATGTAAAADLGATFVRGDVADAADAERAVHEAWDALGGLTTLVNNVGQGMLRPLHEYPVAEFDRSIAVNLSSVFYVSRVALPLFVEAGGGVILNHATCSGRQPPHGEGPYAAAKAGVLSLTRTMALEYGPQGVRSNAVSTGMIRTPLNQMIEGDPSMLADALASNPLGRHVEMDEVAAAFAFLASDDAAYLNGHDLVVDGGAGLPIAGMEVSVKKMAEMIRQLEAG